MTCQEFISRLGDYIDGGMSSGKREQSNNHLAVCRDCAAYLATYRATIRAARWAYDDGGQPSSAQTLQLIDRIMRRSRAGSSQGMTSFI
jgi:anti-sigma factor RsiW